MSQIDIQVANGSNDVFAIPTDRVRRVLNPTDVARYCGVPTEEVLGWIDTGVLRASYVAHGRYRIETGDFLAFLQKFQVAL